MHSWIGPWDEAQKVYLEQSGFDDLVLKTGLPPLVIYDLGLGIATNALAVLQRYQALKTRQPDLRTVNLISFENNLEGLRLALENSGQFPFLRPYQRILEKLLQNRKWTDPSGIEWTLMEGDFRTIDLNTVPRPEIVFYDFYSPKSAPWLWGVGSFQRLANLLGPTSPPMRLITYSAATPVRAAMLLAGFYVGLGRATGHKMETTVASTDPDALARPLDAHWIEHYHRSSKKLPLDFTGSDSEARALIEQVLGSPQFRSRSGS